MIDATEIHAVAPKLDLQKLHNYVPHLQAGAARFAISTFLRETMYVAQLLEESGQFQWFREFASGREYEGRRDLGNIYPGDGERYKGRGPIQLTGRANYTHYGALLGLDLVGHPEWLETPQVGFLVSASYWSQNNLNAYADARNLTGCTRIINGGLNGLSERKRYYELCLQKFSRQDPHNPIPEEVRDYPTPEPHPTEFQDVQILFKAKPAQAGEDIPVGFIEKGSTWAPLRPVCDALGLQIVNVLHNLAVISRSDLSNRAIECRVIKGKGYSPLRAIANYAGVKIDFEPRNMTAVVG